MLIFYTFAEYNNIKSRFALCKATFSNHLLSKLYGDSKYAGKILIAV